MKQLVKWMIVVILVVAVGWLGLSSSAWAAAKMIKIGYTEPFTGAAAEFGTNGWRGIQLALEEINQKGIKIGADTYNIEIVRYDSV